jgi:activating signal cointegrator complex subunit 3
MFIAYFSMFSAVPLHCCVASSTQARWMDANSLTTLPHIDDSIAQQLAARAGITALPQLLHALQRQGGSTKGGSSSSSLGRAEAVKLLGSVLGPTDAEEALKVADRMPIVDVTWRKQQQQPAKAAAGTDGDEHSQQQQEVRWSLEVVLARRGGSGSGRASAAPRVVAPLFPKVKEEGWWLVVGHCASLELLALKRVSFGGKATVKLSFPGYTSAGHQVHTASLFLISDCYMGLDQQYEVPLDEAAAAAAARAQARLSYRSGWGAAGGASSNNAEASGDGWVDGSNTQLGQDGEAAGGAGLSRRARRQQQMAARQHHAAGDANGCGDDAGWEDEPACS